MGSLRTRIPQGCDFVKRLRQYALDLILKGLAQNGIVGCAFQCSRVGIQRILAVSTFEADFPSSMFLFPGMENVPRKTRRFPNRAIGVAAHKSSIPLQPTTHQFSVFKNRPRPHRRRQLSIVTLWITPYPIEPSAFLRRGCSQIIQEGNFPRRLENLAIAYLSTGYQAPITERMGAGTLSRRSTLISSTALQSQDSEVM